MQLIFVLFFPFVSIKRGKHKSANNLQHLRKMHSFWLSSVWEKPKGFSQSFLRGRGKSLAKRPASCFNRCV